LALGRQGEKKKKGGKEARLKRGGGEKKTQLREQSKGTLEWAKVGEPSKEKKKGGGGADFISNSPVWGGREG